ncbi:MAG: DHA2 family efflux MFS transporter permease subunit [Sphingobacteriia bacterium]|nr:DHA2 family efflux MFS transporter permease subunit [Sphingobacteriia bacterium]
MSEISSAENRKGYFIMIIGLFMAILDIQIVASSLGEIQASLSASLDEISWVQTAFLIAEVIVIPITGWLSRVLSTRVLFTYACLLFTISSAACAFSWNLESMIFFRVLQGLFGGVMIPTVFSAIFLIFPKSEQPKATIIAGLVATVAPTLGPTLGGWITSNWSWHWLFLINIIPGIFVSYGVNKHINIDKPNYELVKKFDFLGLFLVIVSLSSLELFLKKGPNNDWFDYWLVKTLFCTLIISSIWLIWHELKCDSPVIDIRAFKDSNFAVGCALSFGIGVGLYGSVYLMPLLLTTVKGYSSLQIGMIMWVTGLFQFASGPIAGILEKKLDLRILLMLGLFIYAIGMVANGFMNLEVSFHELFWPQAIRGISIMLCFLPMTTVAMGKLQPHEVQNASGLYNLMRNLGGAIGIAIIDYYLKMRLKVHQVSIGETLNYAKLSQLGTEGVTSETIENTVTDPSYIDLINLKLLSGAVYKQALIKAFNDTFIAIGLYLFACIFLMLFVKKVEKSDEMSGAH